MRLVASLGQHRISTTFADLRDCGISRAVRDHDTPVLFDWLVEALSFQGISDAVAAGYMDQHGNVRWADIAEALSRNPTCPKLGGAFCPSHVDDCSYKTPSRNSVNGLAECLSPVACFLSSCHVRESDPE